MRWNQSDQKTLKVLLIVEQCNPEWPSVPLEGYRYFQGINQLADVTLVTHERNKPALDKVKGDAKVIYIPESPLLAKYYQGVERITNGKRGVNWPLLNTLSYLLYAEFNDKVYQQFHEAVEQGEYDIVHALTPMMPRYPVKLVNACKDTPFILGPVNGGVPFPKGFEEVARKEFAYLNFLRYMSRFIPDYVETYSRASKILGGSTYTLNMLRQMFKIEDDRIELFYENGVLQDFFDSPRPPREEGIVNLVFVGRLVPYKGADVVVESLSKLSDSTRQKVRFTIVGDGSERGNLEQQVETLGLTEQVRFTGWVDQKETANYYRASDIFCFPSIREFGGAVVLEAMACGLPCIVVDNGGIGEYVIEGITGFKIQPRSREHLVQEFTARLEQLVEDEVLLQTLSQNAVERARQFEWNQKAKEIVEIYEKLMDKVAGPVQERALAGLS